MKTFLVISFFGLSWLKFYLWEFDWLTAYLSIVLINYTFVFIFLEKEIKWPTITVVHIETFTGISRCCDFSVQFINMHSICAWIWQIALQHPLSNDLYCIVIVVSLYYLLYIIYCIISLPHSCWLLQVNSLHISDTSVTWISLRIQTIAICMVCLNQYWRRMNGHVTGSLIGPFEMG